MPDRSASRRTRRSLVVRLLAAACLLQLTAGLVSASLLHDRATPAPSSAVDRPRAVPPTVPAATATSPAPDRAEAVEQLLRTRSAALLARDRAAFLATVDPQAERLRARQASSFDALGQVPLASWSYHLEPDTASAPDARLDRRYGRGRWWAPEVVLSYALDGDPRPVLQDQHLTFVERDGRWLLGADDDFALQGRDTPRALWDRGPVVAARAPGVLVLGRPEQRDLLHELAEVTAAAVPGVTAVWGEWPERVVVLVSTDAEELSALLGGSDVSQIAAYATAELRGGANDYDPTGDRVLVNPDAFAELGPLGRRVVLAHEVTHVASRRASGPALPAWLAEGLADHVGYLDVDVPLTVSARDLARDVRAGRVPTALPTDEDFDGGSPRLSQAYQGSWLAVRLLVELYGQPAFLRLYRAVGAARGTSSEQALDRALRRELGTTTERFTAQWLAALERQLG